MAEYRQVDPRLEECSQLARYTLVGLQLEDRKPLVAQLVAEYCSVVDRREFEWSEESLESLASRSAEYIPLVHKLADNQSSCKLVVVESHQLKLAVVEPRLCLKMKKTNQYQESKSNIGDENHLPAGGGTT